jgi:hypothetical protein
LGRHTENQTPISAGAYSSFVSGGARAIVAMKVGLRVVLMYGFEKKDLGNIEKNELKEFKALAKIYLGFSEEKMSELVREKVLTEIKPETKSVRETKKQN